MRKTLVAISLILPLVLTAGTRYKTFAYLSADKLKTGAAEETAWGNNCYVNFPIDSVTLSAIDVVILFDNQAENVLRASPWLSVIGGQADSIGYFNGASQGYGGIVDAAIARIHGAGKKILFSVTDQGDQDVNYLAQDSARCDGFGRAVAALCKRHNFDGYDINIETGFTTTAANISRFFRICKRTLDAAFSPDSSRLITIVPTPGILYPIGAEPYIDYVMPQYYGMKTAWDGNLNRGAAWPGNAYSRGPWSSAYDAGNMLDNGPQADYIAAGWPSAKLVPGIFATAYTFPGTDTIMGVLGSNYCAETANWYTRDYQLNNGLTGRYNTYTKQYEYGGTQTRATPYAGYQGPGVSAGGKVYITMPNDSTARWFAKFCDSLHLGGVMTWVVDKEMDISKPKGAGRLFTTERLQYWLSLYDGGVDPPPSGSLTATPTSLPAGGGSVTLQWTSTNATSASITPGIGNVATNGSTSTTVSSSTTFTLRLVGSGGTITRTATVSVGSVQPTAGTVYDDSLRQPFNDRSWSCTTNPANTSPVRSGSHSVRIDYSAWGGLSILSGIEGAEIPITNTQYDSLIFDLYTEGSVTVAVGFQEASAAQLSPPANSWQRIAVQLPATPFSRFWIQNYAGGTATAYADNIRFEYNPTKTGIGDTPTLPVDYALAQNFPNPFNPTTTIEFTLPVDGNASLKVFDALGREVAVLSEGFLSAGTHRTTWGAQGCSSGVYFYRLAAGSFSEVRRMILVR
jgi:hypothetical protein